jgi:hypothetical protein
MNAIDTATIMQSTAMAIEKAANAINHNHSLNLKTNLRLTNIKKSLIKQENKSNEIINKIKSKPKNTIKKLFRKPFNRANGLSNETGSRPQ